MDCLGNPHVGLEYQDDLSSVTSPKKVMVIGGAVKAGNAMTAIKEGYEAALKL